MSVQESDLDFYGRCIGSEVSEITFGPKQFDHSSGAAVRRADDGAVFFVKCIEPRTLAQSEDPEGLARQIAEQLVDYCSRLRAVGVKTPDHYEVKILWTGDQPAVCEVASFCGQDLSKVFASGDKDVAGRMIKSMIRQTADAIANPELGIDSHPSNWAQNGGSDVAYIDFWPVRYAHNGTCLVGFPQPQDGDLVSYVASRYYTLPGVMRILRFNLVRAAGSLEDVFFRHARDIIGGDTVDEIFGCLPEVSVRRWLEEKEANKIAAAVESLTDFQIDELREIALRLVPDDPARLTELFELTHLDFRIPAEERARRLARFRKELIGIARSNC